MPVTQAQCADVMPRLGLSLQRRRRRAHGHAAELALRPRDRGRPDRGGDPRPSATTSCRRRRRWRRSSRACGRSRSAASMRCATPLAALDYQETINFSFVEERWERELAGNADPIRVLNPIAAPLAVMRSSLIGSLVERAALQPGAQGAARARVRGRAACSGATPRVRRGDVDRGRHRPADARGGAGLRPGRWRCNGAAPSATVDFFDVKGDVEALLAPRAARFVAAEHPALHPGRSARVELDGARDRPCRRAAPALAPGLRAAAGARCCSSSTSAALQRATCRSRAAGAAPAAGAARHRRWCVRRAA